MKQKRLFKKIATLLPVVCLYSCSPTQFSEVAQNTVSQQKDVPVIPVDPPAKSYKLTNGACNSDSSTKVLSCLTCQVPVVVAKPQLSVKAQALVDVMFLGCQISNKSDLNSFHPSKEMLVNKLNRGSETLYPETTRTAIIDTTIQGLTNVNDSTLRQKVFGGLWYQPPYSDAFETYFGLTVAEAKSTFCWDGDKQTYSITGVTGLYSKQYADCKSNSSALDALNCKEIPSYVAALDYRNQLNNVLTQSITQPFVPPAPQPTQVCHWEKFSGDDLVAAKQQLKVWKSLGRKIALTVVKGNGAGSCSAADESVFQDGMTIEMGSYSCQ